MMRGSEFLTWESPLIDEHGAYFADSCFPNKWRQKMATSILSNASAHKTAVQLSQHGCGRATAYSDANKIVTHQDTTHVSWLDSIAEGFRVRIRTLDRKTGDWSPTYTVGEGYDNHGGPALTLDSDGYLHIVYYPHHHPFRYRRSVRPNDASEWGDEIQFGERCSYPTMVCGADDTLYLTGRESRGDQPWLTNLYIKPPNGEQWQEPIPIFRDDEGGYVRFQEAMAWGPDHRALHLTFWIFDANRAYTIGYLRSPDSGATWERADGTPVSLPATRETVTLVDSEHTELRYGSIAVDPQSNTPYVLYSTCTFSHAPSEAWIARLEPSGKWHHRSLAPEIEQAWNGWSPCMAGALHIADDGQVFIVLTLMKPETAGEQNWAHASSEVIRLHAPDIGGRFTTELLSEPDMAEAHWLPNLERPTGHNRVDVPGVIYTAGPAGEGCDDILSNKVWWVSE